MTDNNNVFILFEEIKTMLEGMKSKLEALPKVIDRQQPDGNYKQDLSPIKDAVAETTKAQSEEIKGLLAKQVFDIHRDEKAIEWVRKQADGYDTSLKTVSDSIMQESIKSKSD